MKKAGAISNFSYPILILMVKDGKAQLIRELARAQENVFLIRVIFFI